MNNTKEIGRRFSHMRRDRGLTQAQAADLLGCSHKTVGNFERGDFRTDADTVLKALALMRQWENEAPDAVREKTMTNYSLRDTIPPVIDPRDYNDHLDRVMVGLHNLILFVSGPTGDITQKTAVVRTSLQYILNHVLPPPTETPR